MRRHQPLGAALGHDLRPPAGQRGLRGRRARLPGRALPRALTRVALIADTHLPRGRRRLPEACVHELERADLILHAGDVVAASVLAELEALAPVEAVFGNMDEPALKTALPERRVVDLDGRRIGLVHIPGAKAGREERLASWFPGCAAVVYGHTHVPQLEPRRGVWILNPGSPTERRRAPSRSMIVLEVAQAGLEPRLLELP